MASTPMERDKSQNSLVCLLQALETEELSIELRDETALVGTVSNVDCYMNVELVNVVRHPKLKKSAPLQFDRFFVSGKLIRFVHIPDHVDMAKLIEKQTMKLTRTLRPKRYDQSKLKKKK